MYFNLPRYFKYYEESKHTPFTPALPLLYAYREALNMILEEGLDNRIKRHRTCSDASVFRFECNRTDTVCKRGFSLYSSYCIKLS